MRAPRLPLLALTLLVAGCNKDKGDRAKQTLESALEATGLPATTAVAETWGGEPLPLTKIEPDSWAAVELPGDPLMGARLEDAWLLRSPDDSTPTYSDDRLELWREGQEPELLRRGISARQVLRVGDDVLVSIEDAEDGDGEGYHLQLVNGAFERVEMPVGHVVQLGERRFVATGWSLSARSFRVIEFGPEGRRILFESEDGVRTVGMGVIGERLFVGVQHRDVSTGASLEARAQAITELERGDGKAAAALAGPARSHLL